LGIPVVRSGDDICECQPQWFYDRIRRHLARGSTVAERPRDAP